MRSTALICIALALPECVAQSVSVAPWMTGQQLVEMLQRPGEFDRATGDVHREQATLKQEFSRIAAESYIDGVHDATEGKTWCYSEKYKPKPDTLHGQIFWGMRALPPDQLKRNAADLIAEIWRQKYPYVPDRVQP